MPKLKFFVFLTMLAFIAALAGFTGCCRYVDCISHDYICFLSVKDSSSSHDLVFGGHRQFNTTDMLCYSVKGSDTSYYSMKLVEFRTRWSDSAISINMYPYTPEKVFIQFKGRDTDTLALQFNTFNTKCCGSVTELNKVSTRGKIVDRSDFPVVMYK